MAAALEGVRVLDISTGMVASVATMVLADYGADVVHVARPGTVDTGRTWQRGTRRVEANLANPADHGAVASLASSADIVLVGLRPEAARRRGLDPTTVTAANRGAIYVALTGFGLNDTRETPGYDALVAAELGAMVTAPGHRPGPVFLGHPALSYSTAFVTLIGALAALRGRVVSGRGDVVDVSLQDGVLAQLTMNWWSESRVSFMRSRTRSGGLDLGTTRMLLRRFRCSDGRLIQVHSGAAGAFGRLMKVLGIDGEISPATGPVESACPLTEDDLVVLERTPDIFASRPADDWLADLWANEVAALPVQQPGEVFADGQVIHNGLIRTMSDPELGEVDVVAPPIQMAASPARAESAPTETVPPDAVSWRAAGLGAPASPQTLGSGPLAGVRVVEFASFFAAPYANRFLCDLGAEVVKVEPTSGDPIRTLPDPFEGASRGKRSLAIDVKAPAARAIIEALLRQADIVQHNLRPGAAERLGIDDASVRALNPNVIYDYAPGYGSTGPKSRLQSFAPLHSGFVGIHAEAGGTGNDPMPTFGNEDYYNGQLNAIASLLALIHRDRTGEGQYVECPQLSSSVFVTSHWYRDRASGELRSVLPRLDGEQTGWSPFQRIYQCLEGWLCVFCADAGQQVAFTKAVLGEDGAGADPERLQYEFFGQTAAHWCETLRAAGVPATVVREAHWVHEFLADEEAQADGRVSAFTHHQHGRVRVIGDLVHLASLVPRGEVRAPTLGEHSADIVEELGFGADVAALESAKVLRCAGERVKP